MAITLNNTDINSALNFSGTNVLNNLNQKLTQGYKND
jgi:hypothetical protein